jgi:hypothetical protein
MDVMAKESTSSTTAPPGLDPVVVPAPRPLDLVIEAWFVETFHGIPDLPVHHFNRFRAAADRLKDRLAAAKE